MEILHVSAECYPVAKAGGLGDVAGALPLYLNMAGHVTKLVMPMYRTKYLYNHKWDVVHKGYSNLGNRWFEFTVIKEPINELGLICTSLILTACWIARKFTGMMTTQKDSLPFR